MGKGWALGTVAIVLALATPASAAATTWTVDPNRSASGCTGTTCKTIDQAAGPAAAGDTIRLLAGFYAQPAAFNKQLTVTGFGAGSAVIFGTVTFEDGGTLQRVAVSGQGNGPAVQVTAPALGSRTVFVESSILSGSGSGAGISATATTLGSVAVEARHVTVADSSGAPALALNDPAGTGTPTATFTNSIALGGGPVTGTNNEISASPQALFVNPGQEAFLLRLGSPAIDQGGGPAGGETTEDVEGEARAGTWDRGADEFVNHPPGAPILIAASTSAAPGQAVTFGAFARDDDSPRGDSPAKYRWNFGDGSAVQETNAASAVSGETTHTYASPGQYQATVTVLDQLGVPSAASNTVTMTVAVGGATRPDTAAPTLAITSPRAGQRLKRGRRAPVLRGRTRDATGVRSVELALRRIVGRSCRWYDGRRAFLLGSCTRPRFFRAVINDFAWSYTFPRRIVPGVGRYDLRARATDFRGNRTTAFSASARTLVGFRIVR
jgi:hypothetical protein